MHLKDNHSKEKLISSLTIFKGEMGTTTSMQILNDQRINEHVSKVPALLICVTGEIVFEDEHGKSEILLPADIINIEPQVKHRVVAKKDSLLLLIK